MFVQGKLYFIIDGPLIKSVMNYLPISSTVAPNKAKKNQAQYHLMFLFNLTAVVWSLNYPGCSLGDC